MNPIHRSFTSRRPSHNLFLSLFVFFCFVFTNTSRAQCCSAGGGCPIAGGASMGVLLEHQFDLNANYQYVSTTKFLKGDSPDKNFLDRFYSKYGYYRIGYGITKSLTVSLEAGNYFTKTQIGLHKRDTISTHGPADFIIFPKYALLNKSGENTHSEITVGLGFKLPMGNPKDTMKQVEPFSGNVYYILKPVAIRNTTGGHDMIFFLSMLQSYPKKNLRFFTNALYIKKGWNELGEKAGDYASVGLFAGKTIKENIGLTLQVKGEWIGQMKTNYDLRMLGFYNYDPDATGSRKVLVVPQVSYSFKSFSWFLSGEFPLYQYVNKEQISSQYFFTTGISYRFIAFSPKVPVGMYYCPMEPEQTSKVPAKCPVCGMDMIQKK